ATTVWVAIGNPPGLQWPLTTLAAATALLAVLGLLDDIRPIGAGQRLAVQALLACGLLVVLHWNSLGLSSLLALPVVLLAILWCTNLYNFMDGIDGIAG